MPVPTDAGGMVFVRQATSAVHLDEIGQLTHTSYRLRILHASALNLGNISIQWNPAIGAPVVHALRVHRGEEVNDILADHEFDILRREENLEEAMLDGTLTAVLRISDLRVGDEIEMSMTMRSNDPTLGASSSGWLFVLPEPAPGRFTTRLSWVENQQPTVRLTPLMEAAAQREAQTITVRFDNPPMLAPPQHAPSRFFWQRVLEYSDFPDWLAISRRFAQLYEDAARLEVSSPVKQEAQRIAASHASPAARAAAALRLVQQEVRYIYVGMGDGNLTPASADLTWQRRYGDCKGKSALLLALLKELGINAWVVAVDNNGNDDGLDARLPNAGLFDHVLVQTVLDGQLHWLDATLPPVASPSSQPMLPYRWVLPLTARGSNIERVEWRVPATPDEITLYEIDARNGFDQPAQISYTTIVRGIGGVLQQAQVSSLTSAQLLNAYRQDRMGGALTTVNSVEWRYDERARASILTVRGTGDVPWRNEGGNGRYLTLPGGGFNPPGPRTRPQEQDQSLPFANERVFSCHVTTVRLPSTTKASDWAYNSEFDETWFGRTYYRAFDMHDGAIRMIRGTRTEQPEIDPQAVRRDNERFDDFDNSMARILYLPSSRSRSQQSGKERVPATYDIDWTADRVPCLAPTSLD
ncbi:MAG: DUF3857 domain-containing protein [Sphingopyxis sp.]|nr:DUF3857 domain-containing protein [Sphingopyxis sp.]